MQNKFESLDKFIKLSNEESKKFLGGNVPEDGTKTPSEYNCTYTVGDTTRTIKDGDVIND